MNDLLQKKNDASFIPSGQYTVTVNGSPVRVHETTDLLVPIHYVHLSSDGPLSVKVETEQKIQTSRLSPERLELPFSVTDNKAEFNLPEPGYYVFKADKLGYLCFFMEKSEADTFDPTAEGVLTFPKSNNETECTKGLQSALNEVSASESLHTLYIGPGIYKTGSLFINSNTTLHLAAGAVIKADLTLDAEAYPEKMDNAAEKKGVKSFIWIRNSENVRIEGDGEIDGDGMNFRSTYQSSAHLLVTWKSSNIYVKGVILSNSANWNTRLRNSSDIKFSNVKVINCRPERHWTCTDGINPDGSSNVLIEDSFIHSGDDAFAVKSCACCEKTPDVENILIRNIVLINNSAAAKVGTETHAENMRNIRFENLDAVRCCRGIAIDGYDYSHICELHFENIFLEEFACGDKNSPKIIDLNVRDLSFRRSPGKCVIKNVHIKNILANAAISSTIIGLDEEHGVQDVTIENLLVCGKKITSLQEGFFEVNDFVKNITFS